jgi:hypothetical protein
VPWLDWQTPLRVPHDRELATRAWSLGIDTLIAQLEQELSDLDKPQGIERVKLPPTEHLYKVAMERSAELQAASQTQVPAAMARKYTYANGTPLQEALSLCPCGSDLCTEPAPPAEEYLEGYMPHRLPAEAIH